jgi:hypothetical protein
MNIFDGWEHCLLTIIIENRSEWPPISDPLIEHCRAKLEERAIHKLCQKCANLISKAGQ